MIEQSEFNYSQETVQPPPEVMRLKAPLNPKVKKLIIVLGILGSVLVLLIIVTLLGKSNKPPVVVPIITPTVVPHYQEESKTKIELDRVWGLIEEANPANNTFPPPQVDMKVAF